VTTVGMEHVRAFRSLDAIAAEKGKLVAMLPSEGTAVLNADDPRVLEMQTRFAGRRVLTYGTARSASVRAEDVRSSWPDRLSFTIVYEGRSYPVQTQLCGTHFVSCVLAALAVGVAMGVPLATAAEAVHAVPPFPGRMSPVTSADGVTFIRDDVKAPLWSLAFSFQFMKDARAQRKLIVLGTLSDYVGESSSKYVTVAKQALEVADVVMFVGPNASKCLKAKSYPNGAALHAISSTEAAREHLERMLQPGDLVLLKGSEMDRLDHLIDARVVPVAERLTHDDGQSLIADTAGSRIRIIVGLGNPGVTHENTPHNVGHRVVDLLAKSMEASFERDDEAVVALINLPATRCYLVKALTPMNATGPVIGRLAQRVGAGPEHCILVHDDIDLPVGTIRTRMSGGDGGHRGVRSVLQAFQSNTVCRVKIGVGRPKGPAEAASHVLTRFDPAEGAIVDRACSDAAVRVRRLAGIGVAHGGTPDGRGTTSSPG
jgi:UDP-N-acetylmuramoyl-tripeptide--D-alanyl-D-alanine ligase